MPYKLLDKRAFNEAYKNEVTDWCNASILNSLIPAHRDRWIEVRRYGQVAIEYRCGARFKIEANGFDGLTDDGKTYTCPGILRKSLGLHNWPSSIKRSPRNTNKLPISLMFHCIYFANRAGRFLIIAYGGCRRPRPVHIYKKYQSHTLRGEKKH